MSKRQRFRQINEARGKVATALATADTSPWGLRVGITMISTYEFSVWVENCIGGHLRG